MKKYFESLLATIFILLVAYSYACAADYRELRDNLLDIISRSPSAEIGISLFVNGKEEISINDDRKYPMLSVFKLHQALAVCDSLQKMGMPLSKKIHVGKEDLRENTYSPLRDRFPEGNFDISIEELLKYTLQQSDNNACDILFRHICGVRDTDRFIRSLGLENFSISRNEDDMHQDLSRCYDNWTYPSEAARLLDMLVSGHAASPVHGKIIMDMLINCDTGKNRLVRHVNDREVITGHKTGTGDRKENGRIIGINDAGFFILPDNTRYALAVFIKDAAGSLEENENVIAVLSQAVYVCLSNEMQKESGE